MPKLSARERASLPDSAFAYVDSRGRRRLPIHDEAHVRNALARFARVSFENDAARERARVRLLNAAKKYGIVPVGFITGQLRSEQRHAAAGRLVIELGRMGAPGELEHQLRSALRDATLAVLHWSESAGAYLDGTGRPVPIPAEQEERAVTYLERKGRPMTALVHDPAALDDPDLTETVLEAVRFVVERESLHGEIQARSTDAATLPTGFVTFLLTDIEDSTALLRQLGDRYAGLLNDVRSTVRQAVLRAGGREVDVRADEFFAVFERAAAAIDAAVAVQRTLGERTWPEGLECRVRAGIHSGRPTLTDTGYIGLSVHTAARVCSVAHGGQIVVSGESRAAVEGSLPPGVRFRNLGRRRLPGLTRAEALFQVEAEGLLVDFPPLRRSAARLTKQER
ncbi:MAG: adenylate/guanylate cyclase domain-containing protein [Actinobacteria bacterium]|nr:adenylate/guanylate cyclase domain-containing protein [Actinomycetota bacterium]